MKQLLVRLKKRADFVTISQQGQKFITDGFVLQILPRSFENKNQIRVGFTTTKKIGNAVKRNRIRRRLKELARLNLSNTALKECDCVFIGRSRTLTYPYDCMVSDLKKILSQLH